MQFLRLNETCYQITSTLLKLGLSGYDVKPRFVRSNVNISYKVHFFFGEFFCGTRHLCKKKLTHPRSF